MLLLFSKFILKLYNDTSCNPAHVTWKDKTLVAYHACIVIFWQDDYLIANYLFTVPVSKEAIQRMASDHI